MHIYISNFLNLKVFFPCGGLQEVTVSVRAAGLSSQDHQPGSSLLFQGSEVDPALGSQSVVPPVHGEWGGAI